MMGIENIGRMRRALGLTQKELARQSGVSQSLIAKIESGHIDPSYSKVRHIFAALESLQKKERRKVEELMSRGIICLKPSDSLKKAVALMRKEDISQLPVLEDGRSVGSVSDGLVLELVSDRGRDLGRMKVREFMRESFPMVPSGSEEQVAADLLRFYSAVLVGKDGAIAGIITKADLLKSIR